MLQFFLSKAVRKSYFVPGRQNICSSVTHTKLLEKTTELVKKEYWKIRELLCIPNIFQKLRIIGDTNLILGISNY